MRHPPSMFLSCCDDALLRIRDIIVDELAIPLKKLKQSYHNVRTQVLDLGLELSPLLGLAWVVSRFLSSPR